MLRKKSKIPDSVQPTSQVLSSIPDAAVRESATTVQEDVDGESLQTEKKSLTN